MYNTSPSTLFASRPVQQAFRTPGSPSSRRSAATTTTEDGGRPRRASKNDLFSMDWKWRGDATGTELREELRLKREGDVSLDGLGLGVDVRREGEEKNGTVRMNNPTFEPPLSADSGSTSTDTNPEEVARITRLDSPPIIFPPSSSSSTSQPAPSQIPVTPKQSASARHLEQPHDQTSDNIRLKVDLENRRLKLGSGRYSNVFLGRYRPARSDDQGPEPLSTDGLEEEPRLSRTGWNICAVKVFNGDEEGWEMAEKEARVLGRVSALPFSSDLTILSSTSSAPQTIGSGSTGSPNGERGEGRVVRKLGLISEDKAELDDHPEETLNQAGLPGSYTHGTGSPRTSMSKPSGSKGIDGLGRGLPARLGSREEERRSVSDSRLVERAAILGLPGVTVSRANSTGRKKSQGEDLARPMLIVQYVPGGTIEAFVKRSPDRVGLELWSKWMRQGLAALDRIRRSGVVHCDLKPANLLLDEDLNLVVADFSSSVIVQTERGEEVLPTDGIGRGTPPYSSPEMVDPCPTRTFGYASDVFSFGATMYSLITGVEPFRGVRSIELMWNVRKGRFWEWEERARIMRIGQGVPVTPTTPGSTRTTAAAIISPPPRMLGGNVMNAEGVRRTGSLRESVLSDRKSLARPKLPRMSSSELLLVTPDTSPMSVSHLDVVGTRHQKDDTAKDQFLLPSHTPLESMDKRERAKSLRIDTRLSNSLTRPDPALPSSSTSVIPIEPYSDGTPAMVHLNGQDRVEEAVWKALRRMVDPDPQKRGTARELLDESF